VVRSSEQPVASCFAGDLPFAVRRSQLQEVDLKEMLPSHIRFGSTVFLQSKRGSVFLHVPRSGIYHVLRKQNISCAAGVYHVFAQQKYIIT
jgi:hypothetical protein